MKINSLYIVGGENKNFIKNLKKNSQIIFFEKKQNDIINQLNLIEEVKKKKINFKTQWLEFQKNVYKKIQIDLNSDKDFNYIFSNLFFESSIYKSNSFYEYFKINLIIDYIKKNKIKKIYLINLSKQICDFFFLNADRLCLSVQILKLKEEKIINKSFLVNFNIIFFIYKFLIGSIFLNKKIYKEKKNFKKVVLSYHFPNSQFNKNIFKSNYYGKVTKLINKRYKWLFLYTGEKLKIRSERNKITNNLNSYGFINDYFSIKDLKKILFNFFRIRKKLKKISIDKLFIFNGVNYKHLFIKDWNFSLNSILLETLFFENNFENFFKNNSNVTEVLYLLEFQPWELMLNKIAHKFNVKTKGIMFSIARQNELNYAHSNFIHPYLYTPDYVGVNDEFSKRLMLKNGFKPNQVKKIEAQRYNYLLNNNKNNKNKKIKTDTILIVTSINLRESIEFLDVFASANLNFRKIYIKEHPNLPIKKVINKLNLKFPLYEILNCPIEEALNYSDIVYVTNGSSVLFESVIKAKITISLISLSTFPIPAINKAHNLFFIYDQNSFKSVLKKIKKNLKKFKFKKIDMPKLYLNYKFLLWDKFLNQ